jgi:hypothetical protein
MDNKKVNKAWLKINTKYAYWKDSTIVKWNKLNHQQKKVVKLLSGGASVLIILAIALAIFIPTSKKTVTQNDVSEHAVTQQKKQVIANKELAKQNKDLNQMDISLAKDISVDNKMVTKDYQAENAELKQQISELMASKEHLATKDDIKTLINIINQNNNSNIELIRQAQQSSDAQIQSVLEHIKKLDKDLHKVMKDSLITVANNDFTVSSIIWVNGTQLLNINDLDLDKNITLKQGQTYKGWDLVSIDNHNCAVFKNSEGINKQCI